MTRQLSNADGDEQAGDQCQEYSQGDAPTRIRHPDDDGKRDRRRRSHVGDGLKERWRQPDGISLESMRDHEIQTNSLVTTGDGRLLGVISRADAEATLAHENAAESAG